MNMRFRFPTSPFSQHYFLLEYLNKKKLFAITGRIIFITISSVIVVIIGAVIQSSFIKPYESTFSLDATTETLELKVVDNNNARILLYHANLFGYDDELAARFKGTLELMPGTTVIIERSGTSNPTINLNNPGKKVGTLYDPEGNHTDIQLGDYLDILYTSFKDSLTDKGHNLLFNLDGFLKVGKNINRPNIDEKPAILRKGTVSVIGRSLISRTSYEGGMQQLYPGDLVTFCHNHKTLKDSISNKGFGLAIIDENPGITLNYRINANRTRVYKTGPKQENSSYDFSVSMISQITMDRALQGFAMVLAAIVTLLNIATFFLDFGMYSIAKKEEQKCNQNKIEKDE